MLYEDIVSYVKKNLKKTAGKEIENHIAVEFNICGEGEGAFYVEIKDGSISVEPYEYYDRDAKILITGEELVKVINGEKTSAESMEEGILNVEGDISKAYDLLTFIKAPVKKSPAKKTAAKKTVKAEKQIVEKTKSKDSKIAKDIKK